MWSDEKPEDFSKKYMQFRVDFKKDQDSALKEIELQRSAEATKERAKEGEESDSSDFVVE